jgi:hypothetical protein
MAVAKEQKVHHSSCCDGVACTECDDRMEVVSAVSFHDHAHGRATEGHAILCIVGQVAQIFSGSAVAGRSRGKVLKEEVGSVVGAGDR